MTSYRNKVPQRPVPIVKPTLLPKLIVSASQAKRSLDSALRQTSRQRQAVLASEAAISCFKLYCSSAKNHLHEYCIGLGWQPVSRMTAEGPD